MKADRRKDVEVAVLMGGWSAEREISLLTGKAVLAALKEAGLRARAVDVDRGLAGNLSAARPDVAFIALHGRGGEDGSVQGLLEMMGIPYTGSGILASALAMDKKYSKWLFDCHGILTPPWRLAAAGEEVRLGDLPFGLPVVVKPVAEGSTIGVSIVRDGGALAGALAEAFKYGPEAIVERFIPGRELTVGVLGRRVLPAVEIIAEEGFYDYRAKYRSRATRYVVPAETTPGLAAGLVEASLRAVEVLGCKGAVRCDFRVEGEMPFLLEVNTVPGMTETSLLPKAAAAAGIPFPRLVEEMVAQALEGR